MEKQNRDKLTEKMFARLMLTSILSILLCAVCLCTTTYAWFSESVSGDHNVIKAGNCLLTVSVCKDGQEVISTSVDDTNGKALELAEGEYIVTLTLPKESASGYLMFTAGGRNYYSDCLKGNNANDQTLTFTLKVIVPQTVLVTARWGMYSGECDINNNELNIA